MDDSTLAVRFARSVSWVACLTLTACGTSAASPPGNLDSGATNPGSVAGNALTGIPAFPVAYALIDTQLTRSECGDETALAGGGYASFAVFLSDYYPYGDAGMEITPSPPAHLLRIEVAGPSYMKSAVPTDAGPIPIAPGAYSIGYEAEDDDDLCSLPAGGSAILDTFAFEGEAGSYAQATALSGTVTITSIASGHIAGSFNVELGAIVYGAVFIDTTHPIALSGTFDATSP